MKSNVRFLCAFSLLVWAFACTGELDDFMLDENGNPVTNEHIKSVSSKGITNRKFRYDSFGRLIEDGGTIFYNKYSYDGKGRLDKIESAVNSSLSSSSYMDPNSPPRTELMTSANTEITWKRLFKYDNQGRLLKIENYSKKDGKSFEFTGFRSFEYEGGNICRENLCDEKGNITQFYEYSYDKRGNRITEKYKVCIFDGTPSNPKLYNEVTYKYDNYKNPYQILNIAGPSFYTSANNMIKMTTIWYSDNSRTTTATQDFVYNTNDYPVKMIYDGGEEAYTY